MADRTIHAVVVGDVMLDSWLRGPVKRIAQEAPVPVVSVENVDEAPGGAANTAANLAALGARVRLLGVVGADECGERLTGMLRLRGVDTWLAAVAGRRTSHKRRLMAGGQLVARYDEEDRGPVPEPVERELTRRLAAAAETADVVIVCDYGSGVCTPGLRRALAALAPPLLVVDAHAVGPWRECAPTAVLPSYGEVLQLLAEAGEDGGEPADRVRHLAARSERLLEVTGAQMVVTTLDGDGTLLHRRGREPYRTYAEPAPEHMTTGAGDTYTAAFALWLAGGAPPEEAAEAAQAAAGVVVRSPGTATCSRHELLRALRQEDGLVQPPERVARRVDEHRRRGHRIVFTNGCFDVLHRGHVAYLEQARRLGDVLVVAVNSDASVARLKGPDRPVNSCEDRMSVLAALQPVDYVTSFDEDTPERLLRMIRPDLYVKGGDYTPEMLPETDLVRELGGEVRVLDYVPDRSSTAIIGRMKAQDVG
ncbi:rfaE bifunctional protein kinase chain/domain/rfaE bifunctional protein nucleotidyltransferase chain/domain [Thermocatellispora tengchongensis]|uniref:Bifunctional protein HldE n=1 Tax=Thermocatellispora tengchongensis TaxID=1073253 RepID=A0A840PJW8_9ACTN|nr:D-glycero-beta-D-manno-heptose 1-phosphate adenylyltransferase [Thermocatellispora tengchongensis]MBB5138111.1 rfaE bifunctional protein kinase chain/domain/rfaE bifunctional protein nucleotidyltransferase chain/domain [Thermocatellispora tengchongensis]